MVLGFSTRRLFSVKLTINTRLSLGYIWLIVKISDNNFEWCFDDSFIISKFIKTKSQILVMNGSSKLHSKLLSLIFTLNCLSKTSVISILDCLFNNLEQFFCLPLPLLTSFWSVLVLWPKHAEVTVHPVSQWLLFYRRWN